MGRGSEMKLEMMSRRCGVTSGFSQTNQTRTAENSPVKSFLSFLEVALECLFGGACGRVYIPFVSKVVQKL